jgi:ornithine carbamoyltransferase
VPGDSNNVCASLTVACAKLGMDFVAATPTGRAAVWDQAENRLHAQKALLALVIR